MSEGQNITLNGNEPYMMTALFFLLMDKKEYGTIKIIAEALFDVGADVAVPWDVYRTACKCVTEAQGAASKSDAERGLELQDSGRNEGRLHATNG